MIYSHQKAMLNDACTWVQHNISEEVIELMIDANDTRRMTFDQIANLLELAGIDIELSNG